MIGLLVGYPSLVSRALAEELLRVERDLRLVMLVPDGSGASDSPESWPLADIARVEVIAGDGSAIDFGLSGRDYMRLAGELDFVVGAGIMADPTAGEAAARRNVGLAREVVELARASARLQRVLWLSNLCVAGRFAGVFHEQDLNVGQAFAGDVEQSVGTAERMLARIGSGICVTVLRTGHLTCRVESREVDKESVFFALVQALLELAPQALLPRPSHAERRVPLVAADYAARVAVELLLARDEASGTLHLLDDDCPTLLELMELVAAESGRRLERDPDAPAERVLFALNTVVSKRRIRALLDVVGSRAEFDVTQGRSFDARVARPSFSSYAAEWIRRMLEEARQVSR